MVHPPDQACVIQAWSTASQNPKRNCASCKNVYFFLGYHPEKKIQNFLFSIGSHVRSAACVVYIIVSHLVLCLRRIGWWVEVTTETLKEQFTGKNPKKKQNFSIKKFEVQIFTGTTELTMLERASHKFSLISYIWNQFVCLFYLKNSPQCSSAVLINGATLFVVILHVNQEFCKKCPIFHLDEVITATSTLIRV